MELQPDGAPETDSRRAMVAMVVILGMMLLWGYFLAPKPRPPAEPPPEQPSTAQPPDVRPGTLAAPGSAVAPATAARPATSAKPDTALKPATATSPTTAAAPTVGPQKAPPELPPRLLVKRSAFFTAEFSNQDGALARLILLDYFRTPADKDRAREKLRKNPDADVAIYGLPLLGQPGLLPSLVVLDAYEPQTKKSKDDAEEPPAPAVFEPGRYEIVEEGERSVTFRTTFLGGRLELSKKFSLPAADAELQRHLDVEIRLHNVGGQDLELPGYALRGAGGIAVDHGPKSWKMDEPTERDRKMGSRYMTAAVSSEARTGDASVARRSAGKLQKGDLFEDTGLVRWSAAQSNYFAVVLEPVRSEGEKNWVRSGGARSVGDYNLATDIQAGGTTLAPDQSVVHRYRLFAGPKTRATLDAYGYGDVRKRGWLDPLVRVMAFILRGAHAAIPNYGAAILILTLIVRACLHPLSRHSQKSMQRMQKLQPVFQEIREKYKHDKQRQQEELVKLQREHGFNPLGGCLPLFLQLPVFIGLFRALRESIELRHAPFLFVSDLSQPDNFLGVVNILPLVSCAIMFAQQRLMPKSTDPQQAQTQKLMGYMMPIMIGFIFYNFPSGLALYFIASTCIGLLEQRLIKRHLDKAGELAPPKPDAKKSGKTKRKASGSSRKRKTF